MVQEISELQSESQGWIEALKRSRESFAQSQKRLLEMASQIPKEKLEDLERFQNQFYIQLLNIHDLKRDVKNHISSLDGQASESLQQLHDGLKTQYVDLEETISQLNNEFDQFSGKAKA